MSWHKERTEGLMKEWFGSVEQQQPATLFSFLRPFWLCSLFFRFFAKQKHDIFSRGRGGRGARKSGAGIDKNDNYSQGRVLCAFGAYCCSHGKTHANFTPARKMCHDISLDTQWRAKRAIVYPDSLHGTLSGLV